MFYLVALALLSVTMLLTLLQVIKSRHLFNKLIAVNAFTTQVLLVIAIYLFATQQSEYIDIALLYALINYVGILVLVKIFTRQQ